MLDRIFGPLARRYKWVATALAVQKRFGDVRGGYLAAAVTLNVFLSLFPLLLVAIAIVGFVANNDADVPRQVIEGLGLTGDQAELMNETLTQASSTRRAASVIGLLGLAWSGLGVVSAIEYAIDATWQLTGRGIKDKLRGLVWDVGALLFLGGSVALTAFIDWLSDGFVLQLVTAVVAIAVSIAFWMWTFLVLTIKRLPWRAYLPGAIVAAIGLEVVKQVAKLVPGLFTGASALYGPIGIIFAILTTLLLFGRLVVYASILNVVRWEEKNGTVTAEIELPNVPGNVPTEADRAGAVET